MHIQIKTSIPGPKSKALMEERKKHVARGPFHSTGIFIHKAHDALIEDVDGNRFIDFASGIGVVNVGHTPQAVVSAVQAQAERVLHAGFNVTPYESYVRLAEKINQKTPGNFSKKTLLVNSGAEAVENAIKIARTFTKRQAIVCFDHAFHGRTYMAMSLTSKAKPYKEGFGPLNSEVYRMPFPYLYREPISESQAFDQFVDRVHSQIGETNVAAVIVEPVLGEGGFVPVPRTYFNKLRDFCTANGILLIADEIQTGFGRTGSLFACETLGIQPDLITLAKGLGAGLPIAAVCGRADVMDAPIEGGIGGTYGGNPVACAAALEVFRTFENPGFLEHVQALGRSLEQYLNEWKEKFAIVGDVRGLGVMRGVELVKNKNTKEPHREAAAAVAKYAHENGVILLTAGTYGNVIRFLMPLTITLDQLNEGLAVVEAGLVKHAGA